MVLLPQEGSVTVTISVEGSTRQLAIDARKATGIDLGKRLEVRASVSAGQGLATTCGSRAGRRTGGCVKTEWKRAGQTG